MKSKIWVTFLMVLLFGVVALGQGQSRRQFVLQVSSGGFVSFKSETSSISTERAVDTHSFAALINSQALAGDDRIIHRVLTDANQRVIFGYDLWINSDPVSRKFSVAVRPAEDAFRRSFLKDGAPTRTAGLFATFPRSTSPQTLDDGDAVSLELLVNRESGVKIVDVVRVTFDRLRLFEGSFESVPKDFTLDAISMAMKSYELSVDGALINRRKSTTGYSGALLWFYVPDRGRFIVSLVPREGYNFQKVGIVDGNRIEFFSDGSHFEWIANGPILANGGAWNLWVLHDKNYSPLFNVGGPTPKPKGPSLIEKLSDVVQVDPRTSGLRVVPGLPKASGRINENSPPQRQQVMVGGADSIENLLPKSSISSP
jgi:hypothetical protein